MTNPLNVCWLTADRDRRDTFAAAWKDVPNSRWRCELRSVAMGSAECDVLVRLDPATQDVSVAMGPLPRAHATIALGGVAEEADVVLSADATVREVVTAVWLVGVLARTRLELQIAEGHKADLHDLSMRDPVTDIPNRRAWDRVTMERISESTAAQTALDMMLIDVDQFKIVNDTRGHAEGDRLLRAVGTALSRCVRSMDFVARLGGDEFGVLLIGVPADRVLPVAERIRNMVSGHLTMQFGRPLTVSAGITRLNLGENSAILMERADRNLRQAKSLGRNRLEGDVDRTS